MCRNLSTQPSLHTHLVETSRRMQKQMMFSPLLPELASKFPCALAEHVGVILSSSAAAQTGPGRSLGHSCGSEQSQDVRTGAGNESPLERDPLRMVGSASSEVGTIPQPITQAPLVLFQGGLQKQVAFLLTGLHARDAHPQVIPRGEI